MRVLIGTKFLKDEPFLKETTSTGAESAPVAIHRCKNPPSGETTRVDFAPLLNKDVTKEGKELLPNKDKSFCSNENAKKHDFAPMMNEAASIAKNEVSKKAPMPDSLRGIIDGIKRSNTG